MQPLEGIRVADFTHIMAGPYATHLLRLLGAEVIKIESPGRGDAMRNYGSDRAYDGMAPAFIAVNAGKKSMSLNLKHAASVQAARRLIARSDVVVENFRPGVMARLGLGYAEAKALKPDIVYCSVSGYGQSGPLRDWPAIDNIVQATSGMMSLGGEPGDPPMRVGFPVVDTLTGQTAAFAILGALLKRQRSGQGEFIDVAMMDASLAFMASAIVPFLVTGQPMERTGNTGYSGQPTAALFEAADGKQISLGVVQQEQFEILARLVNRGEWLTDPHFATADLRRANAAALQSSLSATFRERPAAEWEELLSNAGIPCGMVRDVAEACALPHLSERHLKLPLTIPELPEKKNIEILNAGFQFLNDGPTVDAPPPVAGEHTEELLRWLGIDESQRKLIMRDLKA
jgi:crotonobetainyl-CoA:carnitine CoA-transferase CaiB-like acyl-CoA transferase